jgi:hypothetical protein
MLYYNPTINLFRFIYFNDENPDQVQDKRYDPSSDHNILNVNDTRKTRLTLKMINKLRLAGEARSQEKDTDLILVRSMYANPPAGETPMV